MNLVFEDLKEYRNFINCPDINSSNIRRFDTSPITQSTIFSWALYQQYPTRSKIKVSEFVENHNLDHYIISSRVNHHPNDWAGSQLAYNNTRLNSFHYLNPTYLKDLQSGRAMLLFDQSLEGYQTSWLWQYFHEECEKYDIPPQAIIYVTGNVISNNQYTSWANDKNITNRITVIPYTVFEFDVTMIAKEVKLNSNFNQNYEYKKNNLEKIKTYNCLQKRLRSHRIWFYKYLVDADLTASGLISMNSFDLRQSFFEGKYIDQIEIEKYNKNLPQLIDGKNNNEQPDNYYIRRITDDVFLNSWVSVISEASASDEDETIFLSEKIFKPIICFHPFIVVSNKNYLEKFKEMGYKTFDGFIDETYDKLPTFERYAAIINSIKKIDAIEDKLSWFESIADILIHNYNVLKQNTSVPNPALYKLAECYNNYFNLGKHNV